MANGESRDKENMSEVQKYFALWWLLMERKQLKWMKLSPLDAHNISDPQQHIDTPSVMHMDLFQHMCFLTSQAELQPFWLTGTTFASLGVPSTSNGKERKHTAVSIVVGLRFSLSTAYTLGDMGRRSDGECGSVESLRLKEIRKYILKRIKWNSFLGLHLFVTLRCLVHCLKSEHSACYGIYNI